MSPTQEMRMAPEAEVLVWGWDGIAGGSDAFGGFWGGSSWHRATKQKFSVRRIDTEIFAERRR